MSPLGNTSDFVIIGGVATGPKTAATLARRLPNASITLFEKTRYLSYASCGMPYFASGDLNRFEELTATAYGLPRDEQFFAATRGFAALTGAEVIAIDRRRKIVQVKREGESKIIEHGYGKLVLATGSRPAAPEVDGLAELGYRTHVDLWELPRLPAHLAVLGGGPIGVELAQAFARLGSRVTLLEAGDRILPDEDAELAALLAEALRAEGVDLWTGAAAIGVLRRGDRKVVDVRSGDARRQVEVDEILVAAGRVPNLESLNLAATDVETTRTGIVTDRRLRTTERGVWAIGDVNGRMPWARAAEVQARVAVADAVLPWRTPADPGHPVWAIYTSPELAHAGLTEEQARRQWGEDLRIYRQTFDEVDRAVCEAATVGQVKILCDAHGRLVGGHILAAHAGELLPLLARAVAARERPEALADYLHAYPTIADGILGAGRRAREDGPRAAWRLRLLKRLVRWYV